MRLTFFLPLLCLRVGESETTFETLLLVVSIDLISSQRPPRCCSPPTPNALHLFLTLLSVYNGCCVCPPKPSSLSRHAMAIGRRLRRRKAFVVGKEIRIMSQQSKDLLLPFPCYKLLREFNHINYLRRYCAINFLSRSIGENLYGRSNTRGSYADRMTSILLDLDRLNTTTTG